MDTPAVLYPMLAQHSDRAQSRQHTIYGKLSVMGTSHGNRRESQTEDDVFLAGERRSVLDHPATASTCVMLATCLPLWLLLHRLPLFGSLGLFAYDTFYYLTIAREAVITGWPSFDGIHRTNGFHPVWQFILVWLTHVGWLPPSNPGLSIVRTAKLNLAILTLASGFIAWALTRAVRRSWIVLLALCPGFLWFFQAMVNAHWSALWSNLNGMESSISLFFFGSALVFMPFSLVNSAPDMEPQLGASWRLMAAGLCFAMMVLSRLDDVFFLLPLGSLLWRSRGYSRSTHMVFLGTPIVLLMAYLLYNRITVGIFLPSSGMAKAGFVFWSNLRAAAHMVAPNFWGSPSNAGSQMSLFTETYNRIFGMLAPAIVCSAFLWYRRRFDLLGALCIGVVFKSTYNLCMVELFGQGYWYYGVNLCVANLCVAVALWELLTATKRKSRPASLTRAIPLLASAVLIALCANAFLNWIFLFNGAQMHLFEDRAEIQGLLASVGADRFIEYNDGFLTYLTGVPAMAGLGLALDPAANHALRQGNLLQLAASRGYHYALAINPYQPIIDLAMLRASRGERTTVFGMQLTEFDHFRLQSVSTTHDGSVTLYRLVPRSPPRTDQQHSSNNTR